MTCLVCRAPTPVGSAVCAACAARQGLAPSPGRRPPRGLPLLPFVVVLVLVILGVGGAVLLAAQLGRGDRDAAPPGGLRSEELAADLVCDHAYTDPSAPAFRKGAGQVAEVSVEGILPADGFTHGRPMMVDGGRRSDGVVTLVACAYPVEHETVVPCTYRNQYGENFVVHGYGDATYRVDLVEVRTGRLVARGSLLAPADRPDGCPIVASPGSAAAIGRPSNDALEDEIRRLIAG